MHHDIADVAVSQPPIRLGQFLKLANLVQDGVEAKLRIQQGEVLVNGARETRRGRQLTLGDVIELGGRACRVAAGQH